MGAETGNSPSPAGSRAQALVETALILPIILYLLMGIVDLGRAFYFDTVLARAVREGARVGSVSIDRTDAEIKTAVTAAAVPIAGIGPPAFFCCNIVRSQDVPNPWQKVSVMARYDYTFVAPGMQMLLTPFLTGGNLRLTQTAQMVVLS